MARAVRGLLTEIFSPIREGKRLLRRRPIRAGSLATSPAQKLVIFTEQRDTLNYLERASRRCSARKEAVVVIHGGMGREDRMKAQEPPPRSDGRALSRQMPPAAASTFSARPDGQLRPAEDPNRLEQRFGRIHRIGQTEVRHLWNLIADGTRATAYRCAAGETGRARKALGGQVFDVLRKLQFEGRPLRELLIEAIRYGEEPEVRGRLTKVVVENAFNRSQIQDLPRNGRSRTTRWTQVACIAFDET